MNNMTCPDKNKLASWAGDSDTFKFVSIFPFWHWILLIFDLFSELFGLPNCNLDGILPNDRGVQLHPPRSAKFSSPPLNRRLTFPSLVEQWYPNSTSDYVFGTSRVTVEVKGDQFYIYANLPDGTPFKEEFAVLHISAITILFRGIFPFRFREKPIQSYSQPIFVDNNQTVTLTKTFDDGTQFLMIFKFNKPKSADIM